MASSLVWTITAGVFGLVVGSFLNVCIFRIPRNCMSIAKPRSRCIRCLRSVGWYDNIPVASWVLLRGKCRSCGERISFRYPLVEVLTGAAFAYAAWRTMGQGTASPALAAAFFAVHAYVVSAMIVSTFIDLDFEILPDEITISGVIVGLMVSAGIPQWHAVNGSGLTPVLDNEHVRGLATGALGAFVGGGSIFLIIKLSPYFPVVGRMIRKKMEKLGLEDPMGFGDVKYMAFLGAFLGWQGVLLTFLVACLIGALYGVGSLIVTREMGKVPFGPFLSAGALAVLYFPEAVDGAMQWYLQFARGWAA